MALRFDLSNPNWQTQYNMQQAYSGAPTASDIGQTLGMGLRGIGEKYERTMSPLGKAWQKEIAGKDYKPGEMPDFYDFKQKFRAERAEDARKDFQEAIGRDYDKKPLLKMFFDKEAGKEREKVIEGFGGYEGLSDAQRDVLREEYYDQIGEDRDERANRIFKKLPHSVQSIINQIPDDLKRKDAVLAVISGDRSRLDNWLNSANEFEQNLMNRVIGGMRNINPFREYGTEDEMKELYKKDPSKYFTTEEQKKALAEVGPDEYKFTPIKGIGGLLGAPFKGIQQGIEGVQERLEPNQLNRMQRGAAKIARQEAMQKRLAPLTGMFNRFGESWKSGIAGQRHQIDLEKQRERDIMMRLFRPNLWREQQEQANQMRQQSGATGHFTNIPPAPTPFWSDE
jgi:hypothetical protein